MDTVKAEKIKNVISFWKNEALDDALFSRDIVSRIDLDSPEVIDLIGVRRSGKSSALKLIARGLPDPDSWFYINFEDPFFVENNTATVVEDLVNIYAEYFSPNLKYLFFDEIQNINSWEKAIRKYRDAAKYKIFVTGSSSKLLSGELATLLTGRHLSYDLLPLSFKEYLPFKKISFRSVKDLVVQGDELRKAFREYLFHGGFPQVALSEEYDLLRTYYGDIVQKDILGRYEVRDRDTLEKIGLFLATNSSKLLSPSSLKRLYSVSFDKATKYTGYFKEAMLSYELAPYSSSLKSRQRSLKKIYSVDTGLANAVSMSFSEDKGRLLENSVFLELKRRGEEFYYYKQNGSEIDFAVRKKDGEIELIQVCFDFEDPVTVERELRQIGKVADKLGAKRVMVITMEKKDSISRDGLKVEVVLAYEWMLEGAVL